MGQRTATVASHPTLEPASGSPEQLTPTDDLRRQRRRSALLLAIGTAALFGLHLWLAKDVSQLPRAPGDQFGYLGSARWLSGDPNIYILPNFPYFGLGYPLLLSPLFRVFEQPDVLFRAIVVTNAVLAASLFPLLFAFCRVVLGARDDASLIAALVGSLAPAAIFNSSLAMAENLVLPLTVACILCVWLMMTARPSWQRVLFGPAVAVLYATHERFTPVVPLALVLIVLARRSRVVPTRLAVINAISLVGLVLGNSVLKGELVRSRWIFGIDRPQGTLLYDIRESLIEPIYRSLGQGLGLAVLVGAGFVLVMVMVRRDADAGRSVFARTGVAVRRKVAVVPRRLAIGLIVGGGVAAVVLFRATLADLLLEGIGQAWYLAAGTLGLSAVAVMFLVGSARGPTDADTTGVRLGRRVVDPRQMTIIFLLAAALGVFFASTLFFADIHRRVDHFLYGRHNDSFTPLWIAAGLAFVLSADRPSRATRVVVAASGTVVVLAVALYLARGSDLSGVSSAFAIPALNPFDGNGFILSSFVVKASGVAVAFLLAVLAATSLGAVNVFPKASRILCAAIAGVWFFVAGAERVQPAPSERDWQLPTLLEELDIHRAGMQLGRSSGVPVSYQFFLPDVEASAWNGDLSPGTPYVIAGLQTSSLRQAGARVVLLDRSGRYFGRETLAVWVLPGRTQERLERQGRLLPAGFPARLPELRPDRQLGLLNDPGRPLEVVAGGRLELTVEVEHDGGGSPWPDIRSHQGSGRVQIRARSTSGEAEGPGAPATATAELPHWIRPGESFRVRLALPARQRDGAALRPGRYRYGIDLYQAGFGWFVPRGQEPLQVTIEVTSR